MLDRCMATETGREILQTFGSLEFYDEKMSPDLIGFTAAGTFASCCSNTATPGYRIDRPLRPLASGHLLLRGAAVDAQGFRLPAAPWRRDRSELRASRPAVRYRGRCARRLAGSIGKLYEAETLVGVVPFDDGLNRGAGGRVKPLGAEFRR
jgi:hypothetical protein